MLKFSEGCGIIFNQTCYAWLKMKYFTFSWADSTSPAKVAEEDSTPPPASAAEEDELLLCMYVWIMFSLCLHLHLSVYLNVLQPEWTWIFWRPVKTINELLSMYVWIIIWRIFQIVNIMIHTTCLNSVD